MNIKNIKSLLSVAVLSVALTATACGGNASTSQNTASDTVVTDTADYYDTAENGQIRLNLTALEVTKMMGNGINLGNTMEAYGRVSFGTDAEATSYETYWGQPVTTQESISGMKAAGFDTIRIPVAWTNMMNYESGDYTINQKYLDRVKEITDYARNEGMYVIINDHWDGGWWGMFGSASEETRNDAMELYVSMWTQIAEEFKDYSDYVIFESANEELGYRLNDTDVAKDSGSLSDAECYEVTNKINQTFVDTIRATGGNNEQRFLLIAGFGTDISSTVDSRYVMPTDTASSKLLISVHYYDPSGYCIFTSLSQWGTEDDYDDMNAMLEKMTKFTDQGYGVVIGEYGVLIESSVDDDGDGLPDLKEGTVSYVTNFLDNCNKYNYCPVLWDCNNLYSRDNHKIPYTEMSRLYQKYSLTVENTENESYDQVIEKAENALVKNREGALSGFVLPDDEAVAWIMYNSSDWSTLYSVGDVYDPTSTSAGIVASDVTITGEGTYTVSIDLTGTSGGYGNSFVFCALGLANGEILFPGYVIDIKEIKINDVAVSLEGKPYTSSDDGKCTRVNIYNEWVSVVPSDVRTADGDLSDATPVLISPSNAGNISTMEITFDYIAP